MSGKIDVECISADFAPLLREDVTPIPVEDEALLYDERSGTMHQLNRTAAVVCSLFDGRVKLVELIADVVEVFEGDPQQIETEVMAMARELGRKGLLVGVLGDAELQNEST